VRRSVSAVCKGLLFAAALIPASPATAKRVALVVGIDHYDNLSPAQQLQKAVGDAGAVGEAFRSLGYDVQEADNVSRLDFLRQWQRFLNRLAPGDEGALFFAGHGVEIDGLNFLLPADVPKVASGEEELLKASGLSLSSLLDQARERKPQTMLYVVDACRDNPFVNSNGRSIGGSRGLTLVEPPSGTFVMFSAGAGETALDRLSDDDPNPDSVYTRILLPRLKAPGKIGDIARDVRRGVRELAAKVDHIQTPAFYDEVIGDFCPAGCAPEVKAEAKPEPPPPDPAFDAWNATKSTDSVDVLQAFIAKYASSFYAELAKARMDELKRKRQLASIAPAVPQPSKPDPAIEAWNSVKDSDNVAVIETFIGAYPLSFYADLAREHLKELKQKQQAALVAAPPPKVLPPPQDPILEIWNATKGTQSVPVLEAFVEKYSSSFYAELAKARIEELKRTQQLASLAPEPKPAATASDVEPWNAVKDSGSVDALAAFIDKYPLSFFTAVAKARIEQLQRKQQETAREATVRDIQTALKHIACYDGAINGMWGGGVKEAMDRFERLAKVETPPDEPDQGILDMLNAWKGGDCVPEKTAVPRKEKPVSASRERPAKAVKPAPAKIAKPQPASPPKARVADKPSKLDPSVYCGQGCAGGFEGVLSTTARNPGMKR
jgi:hypothetical protein